MVLLGFAGDVHEKDVMTGVGEIHRSQTHFFIQEFRYKDWIKQEQSAVHIKTPHDRIRIADLKNRIRPHLKGNRLPQECNHNCFIYSPNMKRSMWHIRSYQK
jgi:hypothetical protein